MLKDWDSLSNVDDMLAELKDEEYLRALVKMGETIKDIAHYLLSRRGYLTEDEIDD